MGRPKAQSIRVLPVRDISKNPSVAKHKARKDSAKRKTWLVVWHVEGRQLQKAFRYKQEADTFHDDLERAILQKETFNATTGIPLSWDRQNPTFADFSKEYVARNIKTWEKTTQRSNIESIHLSVVLLRRPDAPAVGSDDAQKLRLWLRGESDSCPQTISRWSLRLSDCTTRVCGLARDEIRLKKDGSTYAATVATRHRTQVGAVFHQAVDDGIIESSPWAKLRRHHKKTKVDSKQQLTNSDIPSVPVALAMINSVEDCSHQILLKVILLAGLRPGEARALRIENVNLPLAGWGALEVREAYTSTAPKSGDANHPKTNNRSVPIPPILVNELRRVIGNRTTGLLGQSPRGLQVSDKKLEQAWRNVCPNTNWVPYSLRHAAATSWIQAGVSPAVVARRLGHSVPTLFEKYVNFMIGDDEPANDRIETLLRESYDIQCVDT